MMHGCMHGVYSTLGVIGTDEGRSCYHMDDELPRTMKVCHHEMSHSISVREKYLRPVSGPLDLEFIERIQSLKV